MLQAPAAVSFVQPLISRGTELQKVEPIVAYFCFYSAVQQVLDAKLHTTDSEVADFATSLLNELEEMKSDGLQSDDAKSILESDEASRAYVLNFAANVFGNMQAAVDRLRVSKATGAGFLAAATFLGLEKVWGPLSPETMEKIKYAKYQAARILGAAKRGEDPNEQYEKEAAERAAEPTVEDDNGEPSTGDLAAGDLATGDPTAGEPTEDSQPVHDELRSHNAEVDESHTAARSAASERSDSEPLDLPVAPDADPSNDLELPGPPREDLEKDLTLPKAPEDEPEGNATTPHHPPGARTAKPPPTPVKPVSQASPRRDSGKPGLNPAEIVALTQATSSAQKHAKYAISALNYDDIKTAVGELESALAVLKPFEKES